MLSGEYAVLDGARALACAVDRYLVCESGSAPRDLIEGAEASWVEGAPRPRALLFAVESLQVARFYLQGRGLPSEGRRFCLSDELRASDGSKLGLGGSAGACVAVVTATLAAARLEPDRARVYALAAFSHAMAQARAGSGVDVAASTLGGTILARAFDARPLLAARQQGPEAFVAAVDETRMRADAVPDPPALALAYTGQPASTAELIRQVDAFRMRSPQVWRQLVERSDRATGRLCRALQAGTLPDLKEAVGEAGDVLEELGKQSGAPLVIPAHRRIAEVARRCSVVAKVSGAGGGDCSVAVGAPDSIEAFVSNLRASGMEAFRVHIARPNPDVLSGP
jgi:phosphomevalonate kinase